MGVYLQKRNGGFESRWRGKWIVDGKLRFAMLNEWRGTPPNPGEKHGDADFEASRGEAKAMLRRIREGEQSAEEEAAIVRTIHAVRYGGKVERVKIADLAAKWDAMPHRAKEERRARVHSVLKRFADYMTDNFPNVTEAGALTAEHFKGFLESIEKSGVSARSWNDYLSILRGVLAKVDGFSKGFREYLVPLQKRTMETVHRRPFDGGELDAIFAAAGEVDPELAPVLVAAACTALRRGDVCRLRWDSVDMAEGFVTVKTSKTGETVEIPIFPPFRAVLEEAASKRKKGVPFVWPRVALAYGQNPDGLNVRLRRVLAAAGFVRPEKVEDAEGGKYDAPEDAEAAAAMVEDGMMREGWTAKRKAKARKILALHFEGKSGAEIARELETSKGGVSTYLHEMEEAGRVAIVSPPKRETPVRATLADFKEGEQRKQRGSLCGWHSFRTTFCTLALANGVPMDLLRKITGHRTAEVVLKHYDRRGRAEMRRAFGAAMPKAIAGAIGDGGKVEAEPKRLDAEAVELEAVPSKVAEVAKMLEGADAATLAKVAAMLAEKGGEK